MSNVIPIRVVVDGSGASILWDETNDEWDFNKKIHIGGETYFDAGTRHYTYDDQANFWSLYTNTDDTFRFNYNGSGDDEIVINTSGNVGIGTATPGSNHAKANNLVVGSGSAGGMAIFNGTGEGWYAFSRANANNTDSYDGGISYDGSRNLKFHTNAGAARMTITGTGNIGIGTTSPNSILHIEKPSGNNTYLQIKQAGVESWQVGTTASSTALSFLNSGLFLLKQPFLVSLDQLKFLPSKYILLFHTILPFRKDLDVAQATRPILFSVDKSKKSNRIDF